MKNKPMPLTLFILLPLIIYAICSVIGCTAYLIYDNVHGNNPWSLWYQIWHLFSILVLQIIMPLLIVMLFGWLLYYLARRAQKRAWRIINLVIYCCLLAGAVLCSTIFAVLYGGFTSDVALIFLVLGVLITYGLHIFVVVCLAKKLLKTPKKLS